MACQLRVHDIALIGNRKKNLIGNQNRKSLQDDGSHRTMPMLPGLQSGLHTGQPVLHTSQPGLHTGRSGLCTGQRGRCTSECTVLIGYRKKRLLDERSHGTVRIMPMPPELRSRVYTGQRGRCTGEYTALRVIGYQRTTQSVQGQRCHEAVGPVCSVPMLPGLQ